jgi:CHAT domain-containing protein
MPYKSKIENKDLIIIPSGKLTYLPFEILITEKKHYNKINYNALPYLLHGNTFNYSYSASLLFENNTSSRNSRKKLGAFAPIYENANQISNNSYSLRQEYREQLYPLKGIKEEVKQISDLLDGDTYLDYNANEKKFKEVAAKYDILHLAMHTIMDDENPMYSKMAFSQNNDSIEDGFLNTYELYNMKLNSRMAVLSSCNSGSGKFQQGEGVMSLARGFIYAGCPSIVMTLWTVEDNSGVKLMTSYYKHLIKGKSKSKALQLSKIDFLENADQLKSHPYFWSGYIVIGNNSSLFIPYKKYLLFLGAFILVIAGLVAIRRNRKVI